LKNRRGKTASKTKMKANLIKAGLVLLGVTVGVFARGVVEARKASA
jgi:hypothetical protein